MKRRKPEAIMTGSLFTREMSDLNVGDRLVIPGRAEFLFLHGYGYLDGRAWMDPEKRPSEPVGPVLRFCVEVTTVDGRRFRDHIVFRPSDPIPEGVEVIGA